MDISKQLDKQKGHWRGKAGAVVSNNGSMSAPNYERTDKGTPITAAAAAWSGWGTALKPAHEPIVVARKPISEKTVAENVLTYGTGAINIDASRVGTEQLGGGTMPDLRDVGAMSKEATGIDKLSFGQNNRPAERKEQPSYTGRFPANLILSHNPDCQEDIQCTEGCPFLEFPNTGGGSYQKTSRKRKGFMLTGSEDNIQEANAPDNYGDNGTAARFFYCAKTSKSERNAGLTDLPTVYVGQSNQSKAELKRGNTDFEGELNNRVTTTKNNHPTVKPLTLIRYLIKLTTKPGGTVLDPFLGSGTTAVAATLDGYNWVGCELTEEYLPIINGRVAYAKAEVAKAKKKKETTPTLFEEDKDEVNEA